jgi:uncharacterized protein
MQIVNATKNTVLADKAELADTPISRLVGLLSRSSLSPGEALVFIPGNSIHTFFMRFTIDVIFLDRHNRVIRAISRLRPWRMTAVYFSSRSCIELPAGTIESTGTSPGDSLSLGTSLLPIKGHP